MTQSSNLPASRRPLVIAGSLWILLWMIPWGPMLPLPENIYMRFFADMLKLGIAIVLFVIPGYLLFLLLQDDHQRYHSWKDLFPVGFAYSVFLITVIGLVGRVSSLSFVVVKSMFALIGLIGMILLARSRRDVMASRKRLGMELLSVLRNPPLALALLLAFLMTIHGALFFIDDTTYGAYLTNWQFSKQLGFENIIHHLDAMEHTRFWLAMYPMGQAVLADLSGIPGLLLMSNYLELYLAPLAVIVSYWFARKLGLSPRLAGFAVLVQVSLYTWMIGNEWPVGKWFYESLAEDKVSVVFFLAPVFFVAGLHFALRGARKDRLLLLCMGIAITLTHPVMLFFSCCIIMAFVFFAWITKQTSLQKLLEVGVLCIVLMIPYAAIRLSDSTGEVSGPYYGNQASSSFQIDKYANIVSDRFYGLNPKVLMLLDIAAESDEHSFYQYVRPLPVILLIVSSVIALWHIRHGAFYWYVLSATLLVFLATLPYTGWILGFFVSARLLSRVSWFAPFGLSAVVIIQAAIEKYQTRSNVPAVKSEDRALLWGLVLCFIFVSPFLFFSLSSRLPEYFEKLEHNRQLTQFGAYIDRQSSAPVTVIALDYTDLQLLPSASARADLISFREELEYNGHNNFLPIEEVRARIAASTIIRSLEPSPEKCYFIKEYKVRFVIVSSQEEERFTSALQTCALTLNVAQRTQQLVLLEVK